MLFELGDQSPRPPGIYRIGLKAEGRRRSRSAVDSLFCFETWRGARVGSHRCPILRPGDFSIACLDGLGMVAIGGPFPASLLKLFVAHGEDLRLATSQLIERGDVAQRAVQADFVIMLDVTGYQPPGVVQ